MAKNTSFALLLNISQWWYDSKGQPRHVSYFQKKPASYELFIPLHVHVPNFAFFVLSGLFFTLFSCLSYSISSTSCSWPRLLSVCVYLLSVPWATNWDTKNKIKKKLELLFFIIHIFAIESQVMLTSYTISLAFLLWPQSSQHKVSHCVLLRSFTASWTDNYSTSSHCYWETDR